MRARHRHFNPRDAEASVAYDSRRISGLSNNDPVSTWPDLSRNGYNATQTGTSRPIYKTNQQGGNPSLNFDGLNDCLSIPVGPTVNTTTGHCISFIVKDNTTTGYPGVIQIKSNQENPYIIFFAPDSDLTYRRVSIGSGGSFSRLCWNTTKDSNVNLWSLTYNGNAAETAANYKLFFNADEKTLTASGPYGSNLGDGAIGAYLSPLQRFIDGDFYSINIIPIDVSSSLRRRLEHAAAYSFKIACS